MSSRHDLTLGIRTSKDEDELARARAGAGRVTAQASDRRERSPVVGAVTRYRPRKHGSKPARRISDNERINSKLHNLTLDVNALKQELCELDMRRTLLQTRVLYTPHDLDGSVMKKASHYFHVFQRGYRLSEYKQPQYVSAVMDPDLSLGITGLGTDMLMEQWRRYTEYFSIRYLTAPAMTLIVNEEEHTSVVRASLHFHGVFTMRTLQVVFPAVLRDPDMTQRLLGKEVTVPALFHLHFNQAGSVTRHDVEADFFTALADALKDAARAASILEEAKVAEESMLDAEEDALPAPQLEPVEQLARTKRVRVVEESATDEREQHHASTDDESKHSERATSVATSKTESLGGTSPSSPSTDWPSPTQEEPYAEPDAWATPREDTRHSVSFLLS